MIADLPEGALLLADKGYDSNALREMVADRKAWANIPPKSNRKDPICFSKHLYRARNRVERFFNKIKNDRRIATRYDKTAESFLAALKLTAVRIWLRVNESMSWLSPQVNCEQRSVCSRLSEGLRRLLLDALLRLVCPLLTRHSSTAALLGPRGVSR